MSEEETKEVPEKKAWRIEKCGWDNLEEQLNELASDGYNIFKVEVLPDQVMDIAVVIAFDPMHMVKQMQKGQMESIKAMMAAGGKMPPGFGGIPGAGGG